MKLCCLLSCDLVLVLLGCFGWKGDKRDGRYQVTRVVVGWGLVVLSLSFVPFHHHHVLHGDVEVDMGMDCFIDCLSLSIYFRVCWFCAHDCVRHVFRHVCGESACCCVSRLVCCVLWNRLHLLSYVFWLNLTVWLTCVCCVCLMSVGVFVKDHTKKNVLAIGDGGNDVGMIQVADVGVGIVGR